MMSKQRFTQFIAIGFMGVFLILALTSLQNAGQTVNAPGTNHQPQPVAAPIAISAPAKATPTPPFDKAQPTIQPAPQPVPTPAGMSEEVVTPSTSTRLPILLLGLLFSGTVVLIFGFATRLRLQHNLNGRSSHPTILAEGVRS